MTDRELLELAAKAAGLDGYKYCVPWRAMAQINSLGEFFGESWNPLTDDGDALRLAVMLRLTIKIVDYEIEVFDIDKCLVSVSMDKYCDYYADTRRAIVRAAAEIGKAM